MKKRLFIFIYISFAFLFLIRVNAAECSNEEKARLKKEAAKVELVYEEKTEKGEITPGMRAEGITEPPLIPYFQMNVYNVTPELHVTIKNDANDKTIYAYDLVAPDGTYQFRWDDIYQIVKFSYTITASTNTNCVGEKLSTKYLVTPKYNTFSDYGICKGITDYKYCKKYIDFDIDYDEQYNFIDSYVNEKKEEEQKKNSKWYKKVIKYISEHKILFIGTTALIGIAGVSIVIKKNNRKRVV